MSTIEQLQNKANAIKSELESLKKIAESTKEEKELKERKKKELTDEIANITIELNDRILLLKDKTDVSSIEELKKAEEVLQTLDNFSWELTNLQKNVVDDISSWPLDGVEKVGDAIWVRDKDNKKMNWWKTAAWVWWAIGVTWAISTIKWWFSSKEDKWSDDKKEGFFNHGVGKWIKYAGVAVGWALWIKWLIDYFNKDKKTDATDKTEEQTKARKEYLEENPEQAKKYISLWDNVDTMYSEFSKKEKLSWRNDGITLDEWYEKYANKDAKDKDTFKAVVPFAVDQEFWSVEKLLSEGWYYWYVRAKNGTELLDTVISLVKTNTKSALISFLNGLSSFIPFVWQNTEEGIKNWFESGDPKQREEELQLFFRQYAKIVTYAQDKHTALKEKIAEKKFGTNAWGFSNLEDAMEDDEWMQKNVLEDTEYLSFYKWSLRNATDILTNYNIFDSKMSSHLSKIVSACDGVRDDVLNTKNWVDSLWRLYDDIKKNAISEDVKKESQESIEEITNDINDELDSTFTYGVATSLHVALNTDDNNVQEFLKESWLSQFKEHLKITLQDYKKKFQDGSITVEEANDYHRLVNSYFAFKKEIMIWAESLQNMKSDNLSVPERAFQTIKAAWWDLFDATAVSMKKLGKWEWIDAWAWWTPAVLLTSWIVALKYPKVAKLLLKIHAFPITLSWWWGKKVLTNRMVAPHLPTKIAIKMRYSWDDLSKIAKNFDDDIKAGRLSLEKAKKIREWSETKLLKWKLWYSWLQYKYLEWWKTTSFISRIENIFPWKTYAEIESELAKTQKLTGDSKKLVTKVTNEIASLQRELKSLGSWPLSTRNVNRIKSEITAFENFSKKISTLSWSESSQLLKATEKISIRTLWKLAYNIDDSKKLWPILEDLLKNSTKIDAPEIAAKLIAAWEHKAAKLFTKENDFNKHIIKELSELHSSKVILAHVDEGIEIIVKLLKKAV